METQTSPEGPLDESQLGEVPQVRAADSADFDRAVMICLNSKGRDAAVRLAAWISAGLKSVAPKDRKGAAFIQIDEPMGDDLKPFERNAFHPPGSIVACVTGARALVDSMVIGALRASAGHAIGGGGFEHILRTVPVWSIVIDNNLIVTDEAYFAGLQPGLRQAGWQVWTLDYNIFSMGWSAPAEYSLLALPEVVPVGRAKQSPKTRPGKG